MVTGARRREEGKGMVEGKTFHYIDLPFYSTRVWPLCCPCTQPLGPQSPYPIRLEFVETSVSRAEIICHSKTSSESAEVSLPFQVDRMGLIGRWTAEGQLGARLEPAANPTPHSVHRLPLRWRRFFTVYPSPIRAPFFETVPLGGI